MWYVFNLFPVSPGVRAFSRLAWKLTDTGKSSVKSADVRWTYLQVNYFGIFWRNAKLQREITRVSERVQKRVPNAFCKVFRTRSRRCSERIRCIRLLLSCTVSPVLWSESASRKQHKSQPRTQVLNVRSYLAWNETLVSAGHVPVIFWRICSIVLEKVQ